jgi:hypothetical protein
LNSTFDILVAEYKIGPSVYEKPYKGDAVRARGYTHIIMGQAPTSRMRLSVLLTRSTSGLVRDRCGIPHHRTSPRVGFAFSTTACHCHPTFANDGTLKITSYVNNPYPEAHASAYLLLEKVIIAALPAWDHALYGYARLEERIIHQ